MIAPLAADPPGRRAAPLPPAVRRAHIVDAALPLLIELGPGVTTRQIAAAAGVAEGTIFSVFAGKDELMTAVFQRAIEPGPFEAAIGRIDAAQPFEQRLVDATELIARRVVEIWRLISSLGYGHHPPPGRLPDSPALAALLAAEPDRIRAQPVEAARLLRSLTLALTHPLLVAEPKSPSEIVDVFLRGIGAPS